MSEIVAWRGDVELWSQALGPAAARPLLLVAGANASAYMWPDELVARLVAAGHRVLRYDHRDTGRSTRRTFAEHPYSIADLAEDAVAILDAHGVDSAHVVGLSMGCTIGQVLALDHRERLRTLTLLCGCALDVDFVGNLLRASAGEPTPDGLPAPDLRVLQVLNRRVGPPRGREEELDRRVAEWRALSGDGVPFDAADFRRWEERAINHAGDLSQPSTHAFATPVALARGAELRGVTTPTLVLQAMRDPLNPPPHGRHLADLIPGARYAEIAGMGHALPSAVHATFVELVSEHTQG